MQRAWTENLSAVLPLQIYSQNNSILPAFLSLSFICKLLIWDEQPPCHMKYVNFNLDTLKHSQQPKLNMLPSKNIPMLADFAEPICWLIIVSNVSSIKYIINQYCQTNTTIMTLVYHRPSSENPDKYCYTRMCIQFLSGAKQWAANNRTMLPMARLMFTKCNLNPDMTWKVFLHFQFTLLKRLLTT